MQKEDNKKGKDVIAERQMGPEGEASRNTTVGADGERTLVWEDDEVLPSDSDVSYDGSALDNANDPATEEHKKSRKPSTPKLGVLGDKTIEDVIAREAKEEQDVSSPFSISRTLGGVIIARAVQRQIGLVLLVCAFLIIYISNRYLCQKKMVEIAKVEKRMRDAHNKAVACTSMLTEKSRESNIMRLLSSYGDSTLTIPSESPFLIRVNE